MKRLKVCIETAVRPIVASQRRKTSMRNELLNHLTQVYERERGHGADEPAALDAALRGFGKPEDLTRELQTTVPRLEVFLWSSVPGLRVLDSTSYLTICRRKPGETLEHRAARNVSLVMLLATAAVALMILAVCMKRITESPDYPLFAELRILLACTFIGVIALSSLLFPGPAIGVGDILLHGDESRPMRTGAFAFAALLSVILFATGMMFLPALYGDGGVAHREIVVLACCALAAPWVYGLLVRLIALDIRRYEEWGSLDIAE